jgi:hypothetical protein
MVLQTAIKDASIPHGWMFVPKLNKKVFRVHVQKLTIE